MQNLPRDILRLVNYYLQWADSFELSFCCKTLLFLSKDKKLLQYSVDKKYNFDENCLQLYHQKYHNISTSNSNTNVNYWLNIWNLSDSSKDYYLLCNRKNGYNLTRHFLERVPKIHVTHLAVYSSQDLSCKNIEDITDKDVKLEILKDILPKDIDLREFDIIMLDKNVRYILVKNSRGILCASFLDWKQSVFKKSVEHKLKFEGILPIQALKMLKIFDIKDLEDIKYLYPCFNIEGIIDNTQTVYKFYNEKSNMKQSVKISYDKIEHEIYIDSSISLSKY